MDVALAQWILLLGAATGVALLARILHLPSALALLLAGVLAAASGLRAPAPLSYEIIYYLLLPPLLFEAAIDLPRRELRRDFAPILALSTLGVLLAAATTALGLVWLLDWPSVPAWLFGALIAATDPVAVLSTFKDAGVAGRVRLLLESESLFNDAVAAVLFSLILAWSGSRAAGGGSAAAAQALALALGGGLLVGWAFGAAIAVLSRWTDTVSAVAVTIAGAYGAFLLAEHQHASGVVATLAAGLTMDGRGPRGGGSRVVAWGVLRARLGEFWTLAGFLSNAVVFLYLGLSVDLGSLAALGGWALALIIALTLLGRAIAVYGLCAPFRRTAWAIPWADQHALWWGGLRGALALALALRVAPDAAYAGPIRAASCAVVLFSILVQGASMPWALRRLRSRKHKETGPAA